MNQKPKPTTQPTNQIKQLNFKVQEDFYWKLKNFASSKRLKMGEVLEKAFKFYEKREAIINELNTYRQTIPTIEKQMQTFQGNMSWLELRLKANNLNPTYFNKIGLVITYQILKDALEVLLRKNESSLFSK